MYKDIIHTKCNNRPYCTVKNTHTHTNEDNMILFNSKHVFVELNCYSPWKSAHNAQRKADRVTTRTLSLFVSGRASDLSLPWVRPSHYVAGLQGCAYTHIHMGRKADIPTRLAQSQSSQPIHYCLTTSYVAQVLQTDGVQPEFLLQDGDIWKWQICSPLPPFLLAQAVLFY